MSTDEGRLPTAKKGREDGSAAAGTGLLAPPGRSSGSCSGRLRFGIRSARFQTEKRVSYYCQNEMSHWSQFTLPSAFLLCCCCCEADRFTFLLLRLSLTSSSAPAAPSTSEAATASRAGCEGCGLRRDPREELLAPEEDSLSPLRSRSRPEVRKRNMTDRGGKFSLSHHHHNHDGSTSKEG